MYGDNTFVVSKVQDSNIENTFFPYSLEIIIVVIFVLVLENKIVQVLYPQALWLLY